MIAPAAPTLTRPQRAKRELARRALARRHLIDFCAYVDPIAARPEAADPFVDNRYRWPHLQLIGETIEQAIDGALWDGVPGVGVKVLLITTPPGHWKSSLVSRKFPAWFIGKRLAEGLSHQVILTSYNATLAQANNRATLELVKTDAYHRLFPEVELSKVSQSSEQWGLAGEPFPACVATGVGGGLTGFHADVAVVDDPIKDRAQANSQTYIDTLWDWWRDVLRTRINRGGFILGIWTRWSENDPAGKLLSGIAEGEMDEQVVMLRLPALAETQKERESAASMGLPVDPADPLGRAPGEALCPEIKTSEEHEATRKAFPLTFESLDQGRPRPAGGFVAGRTQFKTLPSRPAKDVRWCWPTDWAITEKEAAPSKRDPDYTVVGLVGLWTPGGNREDARLVIGFIERGQLDPHEARSMVKDVVLSGPRVPLYAGQANIDKTHFFALRRDADLLGYSIKTLRRSKMPGDKMTRAMPWLEMAHAGLVYVVEGNWNDAFFNEVERFPHGQHDDMIDMVSVGVHALGLAQRDRRAKSAVVKGFGY